MRKRVLQTLLYYRSTGETSRQRWSMLLDEGFVFLQPATPYSSQAPAAPHGPTRAAAAGGAAGGGHADGHDDDGAVVGIDAMIADSASFFVMLQSIGAPHRRGSTGELVRARYYTGVDDLVHERDGMMCRYILRTENAVAAGGALCECYKQGMLEARFTDKNKLGRLELVFDVMAFVQQLTRASGLCLLYTSPSPRDS